ncbi:Scr1 family TA system antitoxin-like transcriptional regulator [Streptomyces xiamenensis]|uniref:Scr1 family TA system antitoxin-like transcriptional regulator n=1 Tax=Streptomyces xiamenensis TaxID=408015 RepID=UPI0035DD130B
MIGVERLLLGTHLALLREQARLTTRQAAAAVRRPVAEIGQIERGEVPATERVVGDLLSRYAAPQPDRAQAEIWRSAPYSTAAQCTEPSPVISRVRADLTTHAYTVRTWDRYALPLPLQTADYARARLEMTHITLSDLDTVAQNHSWMPEPGQHMSTVLGEETLESLDPTVMADQLAHLLKIINMGSVSVRIAPAGSVPRGQNTTLLTLPTVSVTIQDEPGTATYATGDDHLYTAITLLDHADHQALDEATSVRIIRSAMARHRQAGRKRPARTPGTQENW